MNVREVNSNKDFIKLAVFDYKKHCKDEKRVESPYEVKLWAKAYQQGGISALEALGNEMDKEDE